MRTFDIILLAFVYSPTRLSTRTGLVPLCGYRRLLDAIRITDIIVVIVVGSGVIIIGVVACIIELLIITAAMGGAFFFVGVIFGERLLEAVAVILLEYVAIFLGVRFRNYVFRIDVDILLSNLSG